MESHNTKEETDLLLEKKSHHLPLLLRLSRRVSIFLFLLLSAFLTFYVSGSSQNFLDSNISFLLKATALIAISLLLFSIICIILTIFFAFKDKRFLILFNLLFFIFSLFLSAASLVISLAIEKLSEGIDF